MLDLVKFLLVLVFLLYACKLDLESRIVPNRVWKYMLLSSIPITAYQLATSYYLMVHYLVAVFFVLMVIALSYALYLIGAYGGADAKAIMCLALIFPFYPTFSNFPLFGHSFSFAFSTLANSVVAAPFLMIFMFLRNIVREGWRGLRGNVLYYFTGYRAEVKNLPKFHNLLEFIDENEEFKRVRRAVEPDERMLERLKRSGVEKVWVTPALPFLIFITAGYIVAFIFGDLLYLLISTILSW